MRTIIVLAGNRLDYEVWRRQEFRPMTELIYADRAEKLLGVRADELVILESFWELPNAAWLKELAESRINVVQKLREGIGDKHEK